MTKSNNKTEVQLTIDRIEDQIAEAVESIKKLQEVSIEKMLSKIQNISDRIEKVEATSNWTRLNISVMKRDVDTLKLRSDKASDKNIGFESNIS